MKLIWRLLPIVLCVTAVAQNSSTIAHAPIYITHVVVIDTETGKEAFNQLPAVWICLDARPAWAWNWQPDLPCGWSGSDNWGVPA